MKIENWIKSENNVRILHDGKRAFFLTHESKKISNIEGKGLIEEHGKDLKLLRKEAVQKEVENSISINPLKLKDHFYKKGDIENADLVGKTNLSSIKVKSGKVVNEARFIGQSFLEGFLTVYGIELDNAVKKYESKITIYEEQDLKKGERQVFIGKTVNGEMKKLSPNLNTTDNAEKRLQAFKEHMNRQNEKTIDLKLQLQQNQEENNK